MAVKRMERYMELMEKVMAEYEGQSGRKHAKKGPGTGGGCLR